MIKATMSCWICGDNATTGEHRIKHSDLKQLYPNTTQQSPLYHRRDGIKQETIGGLKSDRLKFDALICTKCNNERTQKFDLAWETLSDYLQKNWDIILKDDQINLLDIFPENTTRYMIEVQLFFVKILGCKIEESKSTINLTSFTESIMDEVEHKDIYCSIRDSNIETIGKYSSISDIEVFYKNDNQDEIIYAHMFYTIDQVTIDVIYCPDTSYINLNCAIKPTNIIDYTIKLSKCNYSDALPVYVQSLMKEYKYVK